jgi:3-dehydroquinate synthase
VAVISDRTVSRLYRASFDHCLEDAGAARVTWHVVDPGEKSKSSGVVDALYGELISEHFGRDGVICALGGGVVGDLAGFVAGTIHRGVRFIQVPTTLLAMVDSAIGGKSGINHALGKNLIGVFHQPRAVLSNTRTLATLPPREIAGGFAEVIKYGVIRDAPLFERLETRAAASLALETQPILDIVLTSSSIKAEIVALDELEGGLRAILNFGHSFGHAIEQTAGFGTFSHGEAVAVGMVMAAELGIELGLTPSGLDTRIAQLCRRFGLPTTLERDARMSLMDAVGRDKKVRGTNINFVIPLGLGEVTIESLPLERIRRWLRG